MSEEYSIVAIASAHGKLDELSSIIHRVFNADKVVSMSNYEKGHLDAFMTILETKAYAVEVASATKRVMYDGEDSDGEVTPLNEMQVEYAPNIGEERFDGGFAEALNVLLPEETNPTDGHNVDNFAQLMAALGDVYE